MLQSNYTCVGCGIFVEQRSSNGGRVDFLTCLADLALGEGPGVYQIRCISDSPSPYRFNNASTCMRTFSVYLESYMYEYLCTPLPIHVDLQKAFLQITTNKKGVFETIC